MREVADVSFYYKQNNITIKMKRKDKRIIRKILYTTPSYNKRACLPASATVEAALVIPIYVYAVMTILYLIQIVAIKSSVYQALYDNTRTLSRYAYAYIKYHAGDEKILTAESGGRYNNVVKNGITTAVAQGMLVESLGSDFAQHNHIVGGNAGFNMMKSSIMDGNNVIELTVNYTIKNPFDVFGIGILTVSQSCKTEAWLGENYNEGAGDAQQISKQVYITVMGEVYHIDKSCTYLNPVVYSIGNAELSVARNKSGAKYYPCEKCALNSEGVELYITEYGDRYHVSANCSKLKRTVLEVSLDSVSDRRPCSKCSGGNFD
jgi:hypothetical protein